MKQGATGKSQTLGAFHGEAKIKDNYLARVEAHRLADELVKAAIKCGVLRVDKERWICAPTT